MKRAALAGAAGILILADALLLLGVAGNRRGEPQATLELSEKELTLPHRNEENSALSLALQWRERGFREPGSTWLGPEKLQELGFNPQAVRPVSKSVLAVMELEAEGAEEGSRLKAVDAGLDRAALRSRYPDRGRYAIMHGVVRAFRNARPEPGIRGWLTITPSRVYVPPEYLAVFRGLPATNYPVTRPRYQVSLCFGRRSVAWICGARRLH
ncbi:MAG: DUF4824 family protein [Bryobacterales bacterium]|nr:DUF4824 family protein [Bryobacterales bacterium]